MPSSMAKLSINDLDLVRKRVFVRVDFNVPMKDGAIADDTRIRASLATIEFAMAHGATVILASHLGRPKGKASPQLSLRPVANRLAELLGRPVAFADDCIGDAARKTVDKVVADGGGVVLLENLRFHPEEEKNDPAFARSLARLADAYVNDAFGAAHRAHASTEGMAHHVREKGAGLLLEREVEVLSSLLRKPATPYVAVLGGAKVSDKIGVLENLLGLVQTICIGGAMAYTFLRAQRKPVGRSRVE